MSLSKRKRKYKVLKIDKIFLTKCKLLGIIYIPIYKGVKKCLEKYFLP